jgi:hypothetical protein
MPAEQMLLASLQDTFAMRSFGLLSLHTQNFYRGSVLERVFPRLLQRISQQRERVWTPAGGAITRWWRDREAVHVSVEEQADELVIRLEVTRKSVKNLRLVLFPPAARPPSLAGTKDARLQRLDEQRWAIVLAELDKGVTQLRVRF